MKAVGIIIIILIVAAILIGVFVLRSPGVNGPASNGTPGPTGQTEEIKKAIEAVNSITDDLDDINSSASGLDENTDLSKVFQGQ